MRLQPTGKVENVRVIGVDTPELHHPKKPVQRYATEARDFVVNLLPKGSPVSLRVDQANAAINHRDRYGRLLAHVVLPDGRLLAEVVIRQGFGHALTRYPFDSHLMERFQQAEREAREAERGLWEN